MEVLSGRVIVQPSDPEATVRFYRDQLGLAIAREYPGGVVFHAGSALIEVAAHMAGGDNPSPGCVLWLQVRDMAGARSELEGRGVAILREARTEPWGLVEMHIADPDGLKIIIVEVPADHPLRRDTRADR
ncbi:VOC family protein [Williamsia muralis]|uniref:Glyoxalase n=1 Tax=Williamsia marianensis TaxID=85044 RepID=A0A2G3PP31_WILMA|nr:VOC family protein [Williamsia marianensis]PHV67597.1 glyoxalase [Williamsia marianensis]